MRLLLRLRLLADRVRWRPSSIARMTVGMVSLTVAITLGVDAGFRVLRDDTELAGQVRQRVSENAAFRLATSVASQDPQAIERVAANILAREPDVLSIAVRRLDGRLMFASPGHDQHWKNPEGESSTLDNMLVPLRSGTRSWGAIELAFAPVHRPGFLGWATHPVVLTIGSLLIGGTLVFYAFLRFALRSLDPSRAIPDSVSAALDTLAEGLMILGADGRVVMVNEAFTALHPQASSAASLGRPASSLTWLSRSVEGDLDAHPWNRAIATGTPVVDQLFEIGDSPADMRQVRVNASPVRDARGTVRGCFVSFNDVTELHRANRDLKKTLEDLRSSQSVVEARNSELRASKNRIEQQNRELERLAHYDPLTNVLNRRAFLEQAGAQFDLARADGKPLACVMTDIDKFKSINDNFGHAVGDDVICAVARTLTNALRPGDLLCRYGGEEFCIVLPSLDTRAALAVAERLRARVETEVGVAMRAIPGLRVTASFGVSEVGLGARDLKQLIEEADEALYASKEAGRNFVSLFASAPAALGAWPHTPLNTGDALADLAEEVAGHLEHRRAS